MSEPDNLALFIEAVELLGGDSASAQALAINDRNIRRFKRGELRLHPGILEDLCTALLAHADRVRKVERLLNPAFAANLTADQAARPVKGRTRHRANPPGTNPTPGMERAARTSAGSAPSAAGGRE